MWEEYLSIYKSEHSRIFNLESSSDNSSFINLR